MPDFLGSLERAVPGVARTENGRTVLLPGSSRVVAKVLELANETGTPLAAPGSEVDGSRPVLRLDRLDGIISVDEPSRILHVQAGATLGALESHAHDHGWTFGTPKTDRGEAIGAWLSSGASGHPDKADDPVRQLVAGMELVLPSGEEVAIRPAPRRAVGPDLIQATFGARGRLGVVTGVHLVARPRVGELRLAYVFSDASVASNALFAIRGAGIRPIRSAQVEETIYLDIEAEGPRRAATLRVLDRVVDHHHGKEGSPSDEFPRPCVPESNALLSRLAAELDKNAILQP